MNQWFLAWHPRNHTVHRLRTVLLTLSSDIIRISWPSHNPMADADD
jgi:hypothetical protein